MSPRELLKAADETEQPSQSHGERGNQEGAAQFPLDEQPAEEMRASM
jgi:hypothetical protein